jgi:hypothetical protein
MKSNQEKHKKCANEKEEGSPEQIKYINKNAFSKCKYMIVCRGIS